ncbi:hypothetical protein [Flammeovirga aprica]|uniref:Uncharacterized protein n=1 Tax=Flammeovirga aprica JL-4 TaxID=694437 RepID=A0A7X9XBT4_9BACT|nr:hypothetical protein [Flammeovirga aprica]NME71082.1 hypothetical protein [Flammeovirga aprica JL-4]
MLKYNKTDRSLEIKVRDSYSIDAFYVLLIFSSIGYYRLCYDTGGNGIFSYALIGLCICVVLWQFIVYLPSDRIEVENESITKESYFAFFRIGQKTYEVKKIEQFFVTKSKRLCMIYDGEEKYFLSAESDEEVLNLERLLERYIGLQDYKASEDELLEKQEKKNENVVANNIWNTSINKIASLHPKDILTISHQDYEVYQHFKCQWNNQSQTIIIHLTNATTELLFHYSRTVQKDIYSIETKLNAFEIFNLSSFSTSSFMDYPNKLYYNGEAYNKTYLNQGTLTSTITPKGVAATQVFYFSVNQEEYLRFFKMGENTLSLYHGRKMDRGLIM